MDTSVYIFNMMLDIFIVYTIFTIYFYVLVRFFLHKVEELGIIGFFKTHMEFYKPVISLYKLSSENKKNPDYIPNLIKDKIASSKKEPYNPNYDIPTYIILGSILSFLVILIVYFLIFRKKIVAQLSMNMVLLIIATNIALIISFEILFLFFVYGHTDLFNIAKVLNV